MSDLGTLMDSISSYIKDNDSIKLIERAYYYAENAHKSQFRKSGLPYITHPLDVSIILANLQVSPVTIVSGLLHDVAEDTEYHLDAIQRDFGDEIAMIVDSLTKIANIKKNLSVEQLLAENHRKIFIAMSKDIRVIIVKLSDRLANMRTLNSLSREKQIKIATETLDVYVPIASRLGLSSIKQELEDLAFFYKEPDNYHEIEEKLKTERDSMENSITKMKEDLENILKKNNIEASVSGRAKGIRSIYKKINIRGVNFENIRDIYALRVIVEDHVNCYLVLGLVHEAYVQVPQTFKDYITMPKPNMYQSLHTTVIAYKQMFEIQIRTKSMDEVAEIGIAAHYRYKENTKYDQKKEQKEIEEKLHWFRDFVSFSDENFEDSKSLVDSLQKDIFEANVYVLTPKGQVIALPQGSTPIDFAYRIHTEVGNTAIGGLINGSLVPLNTELQTGDVVSIKTKANSKPSERWLEFVKTNTARSMIKKYLIKEEIKEQKDSLNSSGNSMITDAIRESELNDHEAMTLLKSEEFIKTLAFSNYDDLCLSVATKNTSVNLILEKLRGRLKKTSILDFFKKKEIVKNNNHSIILIGGEDIGVAFSLANCCNPIPGDEIVGFITKTTGIKIHRKICPNIKHDLKRVQEASWNSSLLDAKTQYKTELQVYSTDRANLLVDIMNRLGMLKINVLALNAHKNSETMTCTFDIEISINNAKQLNDIYIQLQMVSGVIEVKRRINN